MWVENRFLQYVVQPVAAAGANDDAPPLPPDVAVADAQLLADARDMVLQLRNAPSVVIWSLCNEGGCDIGQTYGTIAAQKGVIYLADGTRPITANTEWAVGSSDTLTAVLDVMTTSYNYGGYAIYHNRHPFRPFMGGESASCTSDRGEFAPASDDAHVTGDAAPACAAAAWAAAAWAAAASTDNVGERQRRMDGLRLPGRARPAHMARRLVPLRRLRQRGLPEGPRGLLPRVVDARGRDDDRRVAL